jgi:hypothetical protein
MTDNEIIKALECCYTTGTSCEECPMYNFDECNDVLMAKYVRDLINRQQAEYDRLLKAKEQLEVETSEQIHSCCAEIRTLQNSLNAHREELERYQNGQYTELIIADVIKDFVHEIFSPFEGQRYFNKKDLEAIVNNLAKYY